MVAARLDLVLGGPRWMGMVALSEIIPPCLLRCLFLPRCRSSFDKNCIYEAVSSDT